MRPAASAPASAPVTRAADPERLPPEQTTRHTLEFPNRALTFAATAGAIRLTNDQNEPQADIAFIAYALDGADPRARPVTFVFNGGPGMASGWLQVGAIGPWRIPFTGGPSTHPEPQPNPETWLEFTDLVFIDPPDTGYSRILSKNDGTARRLLSVSGDVEVFAESIRRWLDRHDRIVSPKYLMGESYGGFRAPRLARALQSTHGVGVTGIVLISPLLDVHTESGFNDPFNWSDRLPSMTAAARAMQGPVTRADLADVETYAKTGYLTDLVLGVRDKAAVARITARVTALTGIDPAIVALGMGRLDNDVFLHEFDRARGRVGSIYDATVTAPDPSPRDTRGFYADPILEGLSAPVTSAMAALYNGKLNWRPDAVYHLSSEQAFRQWDWGRSMGRPEALTSLQSALALDPRLNVLIAHGLFDLRTPYSTTARLLDQMPLADRVTLAVYPGGHMFYANDASRAAFRDAGRKLYETKPAQ